MGEILPGSKREKAFQEGETTRAETPVYKRSWACWGTGSNHEGLQQKVERTQQKIRPRGSSLTSMY